MTTMVHPMLGEFREEAAVTKRVLDWVPPDKLSWKPHAKSMIWDNWPFTLRRFLEVWHGSRSTRHLMSHRETSCLSSQQMWERFTQLSSKAFATSKRA